jgi:hypothetical protein
MMEIMKISAMVGFWAMIFVTAAINLCIKKRNRMNWTHEMDGLDDGDSGRMLEDPLLAIHTTVHSGCRLMLRILSSKRVCICSTH